MLDRNAVLKSVEPKSDQLNADDLIGGPIEVVIEDVKKGDLEQPIVLVINGGRQPYKPAKCMRRCLIKCLGDTPRNWVGQRLRLYCDPEVKFGGVKVGGIRISHMTGIDRAVEVMLTVSRGKKAAHRIEPLTTTPDVSERVEKAIAAVNAAETEKDVKAYRLVIDRDLMPYATDEQKRALNEALASAVFEESK